MSTPTIVLHLGQTPAQPDLTHRDFTGAPDLAIIDNASLTYYVAQEATEDPLVHGKVCGSTLVSQNDRKVVGALVGNWIASGYVVSRMSHKQFVSTVKKLTKEDAVPVMPITVVVADPEVLAPTM